MSRDFDDDLGYGRPPKWTQFRKGQSGNPRGRPKKRVESPAHPLGESEIDEIFRAELAREISVNEGGRSRKIRMVEVVVRSQLKAAAKGNSAALRDVVSYKVGLEERDLKRASEAEAKKKETYEAIVLWKQRREQEWRIAREAGGIPEEEFPHPDDILLFPKTLDWTLRGPFDETDLPLFEYYRASRDFYMAKATLDRRSPKTRAMGRIMEIIWVSWDVMLPSRWQVSNQDGAKVLWFLEQLPLRNLRALVARYEKTLKACSRPQVSADDRKFAYHWTNKIMKPVLKPYGYRSLAEFERAWEVNGENMPWEITRE